MEAKDSKINLQYIKGINIKNRINRGVEYKC